MAKLDNGVMNSAVFYHKIKLADCFRQSRGEKIPFTENSGWLPPTSRVDPEIIKSYKKIMKKVGDMNVYTNHSAMERRALNKLRKNRKIVIKPADRGVSNCHTI